MSQLRSFGHGVEEGGWCVVRVTNDLYYKYPTRHLPNHAIEEVIKKDLTREEASRWVKLLMGSKL